MLWHGEDVADEGYGGQAMTSAVRTVPLSRVTEVGYRSLLVRDGAEHRVQAVDVYVLLESVDETAPGDRDGEQTTVIRHDAIRLGKSVEGGGGGQMERLLQFARLIADLTGLPLT